MSPESHFRRRQDYVSIRLGLEDWTELPVSDSAEWEALTQLLKAHCDLRGGRVYEVQHNGVDLYLLLKLELSTTIEAVVDSLRRQLQDPFWRAFMDVERFAWVGSYHAVSVRPGDTLASQPLEHPARRWKREHMERHVGRTLEHPWHEAPTPGAAGIEFVACVRFPTAPESTRFDLVYHKLETGEKEAWAAAHLNTRLRIPGTGPWLESVGWDYRSSLPRMVFSVPSELLSVLPPSVEVWWATGERKLADVLPCYEAGNEPAFLREGEF